MKTSINKILLLCFTVLVFTSCSKDEDCDPSDEHSACYTGLSADARLLLIEEKVNGETELTFEYDEDNRVAISRVYPRNGGVLTTRNITYNDKGQMISVRHFASGESLLREDYVYGSTDKPLSCTISYPENIITIKYSYDENTTTETSYSPNGELLSVNTYVFDGKGENLIKITFSMGGIWQTTQEFGDFDDKPYRFTGYPWRWKLRSANNAESYKLSNAEGGVDQIWKYTYNQAGYPVKADIYNRGSDVIVETREYIYKNAR